MMITMIEARVAKENWPLLEQAYQRSSGQTPPGLEQSFLIHSVEDEEVWQIVTVWSGMASLPQIQQSKEAGITPRGVLIFREAHAEPAHSVFEVVQHLVSASREA
jgi:heme-degrading monooxygenase HmoA